MAFDVFTEDRLRVIGKTPGQIYDYILSLGRFIDQCRLCQIPLEICERPRFIRPRNLRCPVQYRYFITLLGKIFQQIPPNLARTAHD
jgi:hypothetical protein